jgi:hypothetical protein
VELLPVAERLDCVQELNDLLRILEVNPSYARQRDWIAGGANLEEVVAGLRQELTDDLQGGGSTG